MKGVGPLYDELHDLLDRDYDAGPSTARSRSLRLRSARRASSPADRDDELRRRARACIRRGRGETRRCLVHLARTAPRPFPPRLRRGRGRRSRRPQRVHRSLARRSHGRAQTARPGRPSPGAGVGELRGHGGRSHRLPRAGRYHQPRAGTLVARLRRSHFLFLGYPLRDWGLRVFLHRIWGREKVAYWSWAVEDSIEPVERELWRQRGVDVFDVPLDEYVAELAYRVTEAARRDGDRLSVQGSGVVRRLRLGRRLVLRAGPRAGDHLRESHGLEADRSLRRHGRGEELRAPGRRGAHAAFRGGIRSV